MDDCRYCYQALQKLKKKDPKNQMLFYRELNVMIGKR